MPKVSKQEFKAFLTNVVLEIKTAKAAKAAEEEFVWMIDALRKGESEC